MEVQGEPLGLPLQLAPEPRPAKLAEETRRFPELLLAYALKVPCLEGALHARSLGRGALIKASGRFLKRP